MLNLFYAKKETDPKGHSDFSRVTQPAGCKARMGNWAKLGDGYVFFFILDSTVLGEGKVGYRSQEGKGWLGGLGKTIAGKEAEV